MVHVHFLINKLNIEHIMPQTSNDYWKKISNLNADEYTDVVNRLGNLTLAAAVDNSKMGNGDFNYKKSILESTKRLRLNTAICEKDKWTVEDINERTQVLIDKILELFPYVQSTYRAPKEYSNRYITLTAGNLSAMGYLNEDNSLTVFAGSEIRVFTLPNSNSLKELRDDFIEENIIELENEKYILKQDYTFNSPSSATDFVLGGSNNGWNYWKDENGVIINDSLRNLNG